MTRSTIAVLAFLALGTMTNAVAPEPGKTTPALLVVNQYDQTLGIVDPASNREVDTIPSGDAKGWAHEVITSPDGRTAFAPIYGDRGVGAPGTNGSSMAVIDLASRKTIATVDFGHGVRPHCPQFNSRDGLLYVTTELDQTVSIIDPKTLKIVGTIPTGQPQSHMLAISSDGRRGYTANVGPGTVSVLDLENRKTITVIPISRITQRISITPDDRMVFTADQTKPQLAVIDTATNQIKTWVPIPAPGYGTASTHDGRWLVVAIPKLNQVAIVDLHTLKVTHTVDVPDFPQEVLVRPDDQVAYVSCAHAAKVAAIDLNNWTVAGVIDAGKFSDGLAWSAPR